MLTLAGALRAHKQLELGSKGLNLRCVYSENFRIAVIGSPTDARKRAGAGYHDLCVNYSLRRRQVLTELSLIFRVILQKNTVIPTERNGGWTPGA